MKIKRIIIINLPTHIVPTMLALHFAFEPYTVSAVPVSIVSLLVMLNLNCPAIDCYLYLYCCCSPGNSGLNCTNLRFVVAREN